MTAALNYIGALEDFVNKPETLKNDPDKTSAFFAGLTVYYFKCNDSVKTNIIRRIVHQKMELLREHLPHDTILKSKNIEIQAKGLCLALSFSQFERWIREAADTREPNTFFQVSVTDINPLHLQKLVNHAEKNETLDKELEFYKADLNVCSSPRLSPRLTPLNSDPDNKGMKFIRRRSSGHSSLAGSPLQSHILDRV